MTLQDIEEYEYRMKKKMAPFVFWITVGLALLQLFGIGVAFYHGDYLSGALLFLPYFMSASCAVIVRKWRKQNP
jgi:hypothetical protein